MDDRIVLAHGGGGMLMRELIEKTIGPAIGGLPAEMPDAAPVPGADEFLMTTDSFVVKPLFFQGGDIGSLSVHGTINDLAVSGAEPLALSMAIIIEEGLEIAVLRRVLESAGAAARACGVRIVTGDTKVVARGEADQLFITTAGIGRRRARLSAVAIRKGDALILSGAIAEHGIAVMSARKGIEFSTPVRSDSASVWPLAKALIESGAAVRVMRDPTRGGVSACVAELAEAAKVTVQIDEAALPVSREVAGACEMLGLDPLGVANEGKLIAFVASADAEKAVMALRAVAGGQRVGAGQGVAGGQNARVIGRAVARREKSAYLRTRFGGERIIEIPYGEELPRIC